MKFLIEYTDTADQKILIYDIEYCSFDTEPTVREINFDVVINKLNLTAIDDDNKIVQVWGFCGYNEWIKSRYEAPERRIQVTNATFRSWFINWLKTWFGVSKLSLFLGLLFSSFSTNLIYSSVMVSKFVFLGIYWRTKPLRFSFAPLSQLD